MRLLMRFAFASPIVFAVALVACGTASTPPASREQGWTTFAELQQPRAFAQAVALPTGEILVIGGLNQADPQVTNYRSELIDPLTHKVAVLSQQLIGRLHQTVTVAADERVVEAGGVVWSGGYWSPVDRVDVFDVRTNTWRSAAPLHGARSDHAAVSLKDGRVMVIGGNFDTKLLKTTEIYDARSDSWTIAASMPRPRTQHSAVRLADGRVLVAGGIDVDGGATDSTFIYDPATDAWSDGPRMTQPRLQEAVVALPSGDVLFAGGDDAAAGSAEIYLAKENRFVPTGSLVHPRFVAQGAALPDGRVALNGGLPPHASSYAPLNSTELWDPRTGTWSEAASVSSARAWGKLLWVGDALFLVSGTGPNESPVSSVERLTLD